MAVKRTDSKADFEVGRGTLEEIRKSNEMDLTLICPERSWFISFELRKEGREGADAIHMNVVLGEHGFITLVKGIDMVRFEAGKQSDVWKCETVYPFGIFEMD